MRLRPALVLFCFMTSALLAVAEAQADEAARLRALLEREWTVRLAESPLLATYVGVHTSGDQLGRTTEEDLARRERETRAFLDALGEDRPRGAAAHRSGELRPLRHGAPGSPRLAPVR